MHNCALAKERSPFIGEECRLCFLLCQLLFYLRENWCWSQVIPSLTFPFSSSSNDNISRLSSAVNVPVPPSCCCCHYSVTKQRPTLCDPMGCSTPGSLSSTISWSLLSFMSVESMMLSISSSAAPFSFCFQSFPPLVRFFYLYPHNTFTCRVLWGPSTYIC